MAFIGWVGGNDIKNGTLLTSGYIYMSEIIEDPLDLRN